VLLRGRNCNGRRLTRSAVYVRRNEDVSVDKTETSDSREGSLRGKERGKKKGSRAERTHALTSASVSQEEKREKRLREDRSSCDPENHLKERKVRVEEKTSAISEGLRRRTLLDSPEKGT